MHIELIGSTSAGKTTLAKKMVKIGKDYGLDVSLSDDFMLDQLHLSWIKNDFMRRRVVEIVAFSIYITCLIRYKEFFDFVVRESKTFSGSWFYRLNRIRNVIRKIGIFEFISRKSGSHQIVLADNEGILQGAHNLFVHQSSQADLQKIARYVELVPLPDVVLYLQLEEEILVSRTLGRGHARVSESSPDKVVHFIKQAVSVFNEMVNMPMVREKLLVLDSGLNVRYEAENPNFRQILDLVAAQ